MAVSPITAVIEQGVNDLRKIQKERKPTAFMEMFDFSGIQDRN